MDAEQAAEIVARVRRGKAGFGLADLATAAAWCWPEAQYEAGWRLIAGEGLKRDRGLGLRHLALAARRVPAAELARQGRSRDGLAGNDEKWLEIRRTRALAGDPAAMVELGLASLPPRLQTIAAGGFPTGPGDALTPDALAAARRWLRCAADGGHAMANYWLGTLAPWDLFRGADGAAGAEARLQAAAAAGALAAREDLGWRNLARGLGPGALTLAAEAGSLTAAYALAERALAGDDGPPDYGAALRWHAAAAEGGHEGAIARHQAVFHGGALDPGRPEVRYDLAMQAARAGSAPAATLAAGLRERGEGVARDAAHARALYDMAAAAGEPRATAVVIARESLVDPQAALARALETWAPVGEDPWPALVGTRGGPARAAFHLAEGLAPTNPDGAARWYAVASLFGLRDPATATRARFRLAALVAAGAADPAPWPSAPGYGPGGPYDQAIDVLLAYAPLPPGDSDPEGVAIAAAAGDPAAAYALAASAPGPATLPVLRRAAAAGYLPACALYARMTYIADVAAAAGVGDRPTHLATARTRAQTAFQWIADQVEAQADAPTLSPTVVRRPAP